MDANSDCYIKGDGGMFINSRFINWIKQIDECYNVCTKSGGCYMVDGTHKICKLNNPTGYNKLTELINKN